MNAIPPSCIAVDWGSTHLRAKRIRDGQVIDEIQSADGIRHRAGRDYEEILTSVCGAWKTEQPELPLYLSGMIGSREGWQEVPYVEAPCGAEELAAGVLRLPSTSLGEVFLFPGVRWIDPERNTIEVMRGEEVEVMGCLEAIDSEQATIVLPGTHSKWVHCRDGKIESFRTWLTGEAFDRFHRESLLSGDDSSADPNSPAFAKGIEVSGQPGGLLHHLFQARTRRLTGQLELNEVGSFLSGLLVGSELREATRWIGEESIHLVGNSAAAQAMASACRLLDLSLTLDKTDPHLKGLLRVASFLRSPS